jgi:hypothetical protein
MKYTRYDLKRQKNGGKILILILALVVLLAIIIGTIIYKIIAANPKVNSKNGINNSTVIKNNSNISSKITKFIVVSGGMYANKNNVTPQVNILKSYGNPFTVEQDGKTRVFLGIYNEKDGLSIIKTLTDKKVTYSKMTFQISSSDMCDAEISEIVNANMDIIKKLSDSNVKAIKTSDFKKWIVALGKVDSSSKHIAQLNSLKDYMGKLPDLISKDKITGNYTFLYSILQQTSK